MNNGASNFSPERIAALRKNIDLSDIPEITDFSLGHLRNNNSSKVSFIFSFDSDVYERFIKTGLDLESYIKTSVLAVANSVSA